MSPSIRPIQNPVKSVPTAETQVMKSKDEATVVRLRLWMWVNLVVCIRIPLKGTFGCYNTVSCKDSCNRV